MNELKKEIENKIKNIEKQLISGNLGLAVNELIDLLMAYFYDSDEFKTGSAISNHFHFTEKQHLKGLINFDKINLERNIIVNRIQSLIFTIKQRQLKRESEFNVEGKREVVGDSKIKPILEENFELEEKINKQVVFKGRGVCKKIARGLFEIRDVSFEVKTGEIVALIGSNSSGKTTLLKIIAGHLQVDRGVLEYPMLNSGKLDWKLIKENIAYVPQELSSVRGTLLQNLFYILGRCGYKKNDIEKTVEYYVQRMDLHEHRNKHWKELSTGYKLRFSLVMALIWKPKLILLDEPLANLDVNSQSIILDDLKKIVNLPHNKAGVIFTSQHLHELDIVYDKAVLLDDGRPVFNGSRRHLIRKKPHRVFEVIVNGENDVVKSQLLEIGVVNTNLNKNHFIIFCEKGMGEQQVLKAIKKSGTAIIYFRNISNSLRKLFV